MTRAGKGQTVGVGIGVDVGMGVLVGLGVGVFVGRKVGTAVGMGIEVGDGIIGIVGATDASGLTGFATQFPPSQHRGAPQSQAHVKISRQLDCTQLSAQDVGNS